ncbi:hypothetical protein [Haloferula sp.]|uniref:hypothetical protein n=1 Tax=Haloferula sp. TaxID=2497595 RepID=UPI00329DA3CD
MHFIGMLMLISGFTGVIAFAVLGLTKILPLALCIHGVLFASALFYATKLPNGIRNLTHTNCEPLSKIKYLASICGGFFFLISGAYIATIIEPGDQPNAMSQSDQVYFGALFMLAGAGVCLIQVHRWIDQVRSAI